MHELSITQSVVDMCSERAMGSQVLRITLEIGKFSAILPDSVRFCFDICARGTPVEGAELEIVERAGLARCMDCGNEFVTEDLLGSCTCGSINLQLVAGDELKVKEMEVMDVRDLRLLQ